MIIYKRNFDENKCIHFFLKKKEKVSTKYMEILENVRNIIKNNLIVNLYIVKNI